MNGRPQPNEAAPYYFTYINQVAGEDAVAVIRKQADEYTPFLQSISEEQSLHRYAPGKWSIRQVLNHVTDTERAFAFRALWFARSFKEPLPSYDPDMAAAGADADQISWAANVEEFRRVRLATVSLFENLPADAWMRTGTASGNLFTVRALGFIIPGHTIHHFTILRERYLLNGG
jgi:DinB superfamily